MKNLKNISLLFLILTCSGFYGCITTTALYGEDSCGKGNTAYPTANGTAAVCMEEKRVAYLLCVRELGTASIAENKSGSIDISASVKASGLPADADAEVKKAYANTLNTLYQNEGKIADARARAIEECLQMLK